MSDDQIVAEIRLWDGATADDLYSLLGKFRHSQLKLDFEHVSDDDCDFYIVREADDE